MVFNIPHVTHESEQGLDSNLEINQLQFGCVYLSTNLEYKSFSLFNVIANENHLAQRENTVYHETPVTQAKPKE